MGTGRSFALSLIAVLCLLTACSGQAGTGPTATPDPALMDILERTIWEIEGLRSEVEALAAAAEATPAEELEPILMEMDSLWQTIPEFPLFAARAGSALREYGFHTEQCYIGKYMEYLTEESGQEMRGSNEDSCDLAQSYKETLDLYLQELKESSAGE